MCSPWTVATTSPGLLMLRSNSTVWASIIPSFSPKAGKDEGTKLVKASTLHFLRHHLHPDLKYEYMTDRNPLVLWQSLKDLFSQQQSIVLPRAQQDWITLRFQDFESVAMYNSALHRILTKICLCGQKIIDTDMIEKTLST